MDQSPGEITIPVIEAVSDVLEIPIDELPPLSTSIDPDALNAIVTDDTPDGVTVTFSYAGLCVFVYSRTAIYVCPLQEEFRGPFD